MDYRGSFLNHTLQVPVTAWRNHDAYAFSLMLPLLLLTIVVMVPIAIVVDFCRACAVAFDE